MEFINTIIGIPLGYIMWLCYITVGNYGIAILLFTLLTRVLMFPLNIWVQKNSIKMVKLQPKLNEIAASCVGNRDMIAEKQFALYKRENYKPLAGIIPMLIQIPIILGLISVVYNPLQHLMHLSPDLINAFVHKASEILGNADLGSAAQLKVIELVNDPSYIAAFSNINIPGAADAISGIRAFDLNFLGINLSQTPSLLDFRPLILIPFLSGGSALLLSAAQNKVNVLQREANWFGRWGMAIFLTLFSLYFAFIVPAGLGVYWIISNLLAIIVMLAVNLIYPPKKHIDYDALEKSKIALAQSKELEKKLKPTVEQKNKAKEDYKRFFKNDTKKLVFYSEKSGFYKYFKGVIEYILKHSDVDIHYVTSDPNDAVFKMNEPHLIPYYIDDIRLIPLFMKMDSDLVVMTTPDLEQFHLKRSLVKRDIEYIYMFHGPLSTNMVVRKGSYDHYDTILCSGQHQIDELRECEAMYNLPAKNLVPCGYGLLDELIKDYESMEKTEGRKRVLIAPSYQENGIMDTCIDRMLEIILGHGFIVIVRPHPQYIRYNPGKINEMKQRYSAHLDNDFIIESDFSNNASIYSSDILITDWSGIAYEFSFTTKKPSIFINTPMKVLNPDYDKYVNKPLDITLREQVGVTIEPDNLESLIDVITDMLKENDVYKQKISQIRSACVFNLGSGSKIAAEYILSRLKEDNKQYA